ncbi:hypothetical protein D6L13_03860 [Salmonella enterica subsp. enterica serovar Ordonez]|nr:hypothetical protein [Salmonella enterica subsp. enterica serovar Ordonez]
MENQNEQTNAETKSPAKAPVVGGKREPSFAQAIFGAAKEPAQEKGSKEPEDGAGAQPESAEIDLLAGTDNSTTLAGGAGAGEEEPETVDVWQFNGVDYTADQVEEALRERESYQRLNQSVQPLAEAIQRAEDDTARFKEMALTETDKMIAQLKKEIQSGRLDPRQKAAAYDQIEEAIKRQKDLNQAAELNAQARAAAMEKVREQRARQTVNAMAKQGWSREEILSVGASIQKVVGEGVGDVISPALMQVFKDSAELHRLRNEHGKRLATKNANALKMTRQAPQTKETKQTSKKEKTFGAMIFGG